MRFLLVWLLATVAFAAGPVPPGAAAPGGFSSGNLLRAVFCGVVMAIAICLVPLVVTEHFS